MVLLAPYVPPKCGTFASQNNYTTVSLLSKRLLSLKCGLCDKEKGSILLGGTVMSVCSGPGRPHETLAGTPSLSLKLQKTSVSFQIRGGELSGSGLPLRKEMFHPSNNAKGAQRSD
jgi:hypothetical protein